MEEPLEELHYQDMWEKAILKYFEIVPVEDDDTFRQELNKVRKEKPQESSSEGTSFTPRVLKILEGCVGLIGEGASLAFPAAGIIAAVTQRLVKATREYTELFDNLLPLKERVNECFRELDEFEKFEKSGFNIESTVTSCDFQILCCHIRICAFITKYSKDSESMTASETTELELEKEDTEKQSRRKKIFGHFSLPKKRQESLKKHVESFSDKSKIFFQLLTGSNEISEELDRIDALGKKRTAAMDSLNFREIKRTAKATQDQQDRDFLKDCLRKIKEKLNIRDQPWEEINARLTGQVVDGTGNWLMAHESFHDWENLDFELEHPLLKLEAQKKYGKTFLCNRVIARLRAKFNGDQETAVATDPSNRNSDLKPSTSVAFYYFGTSDKEKPSLQDALASIIWQLAQNDKVYRKEVAAACKKISDFPKSHELWNLLRPGQASQFFIIFDGIDHAADGAVYELADILANGAPQELMKPRLRIFLSGTPQCLEHMKTWGSSIQVPDYNENDIELFVKERLKVFEVSHDQQLTDTPGPNKELLEMLHNLPEKLTRYRDYDFLNFLLGNINSGGAWLDSTLKSVIDGLSTDEEFDLVDFQIRHLNQVLSRNEIQDLNEILPWVVLPNREWPKMKQLEDVLTLRRGTPALKPLKTYITGTFFALLDFDDDIVTSARVNGHYRAKFNISEESSVSNFTEQRRDETRIINRLHPSEIRLVERFLRKFCDDDLYEKFGFDEFFKQKKDPQEAGIHFDPISGHVKMITACVMSMTREDRETFTSLRDYTAKWLPWHLSEIRPEILSDSQLQVMANLIPHLCKFFEDVDIVKFWMVPELIEDLIEAWFPKTSNPDRITDWFNHHLVIGSIPEDWKEDVQNFRRGLRNQLNEVELLRNATRIAARAWLLPEKDESWDIAKTVNWVVNFVTGTEYCRPTENKGDFVSATAILRAEDWAHDALDIPKGSHLSNLRVGMAFMHLGHPEEAMKRCRVVIESNPDVEIAPQVARCYFESRKKSPPCPPGTAATDALETIEPLFESKRSNFHGFEDEESRNSWSAMLDLMSDVLHEAGKDHDAIQTCQELLQISPKNYGSMAKMLTWMKGCEKDKDMIMALQALGPGSLVEFFLHPALDVDLYRFIAIAAAKSSELNFAETCKAASEAYGGSKSSVVFLDFCHALTLSYSHKGDSNMAAEIWKEIIGLEKEEEDEDTQVRISELQIMAGRKLASWKFQEVKNQNWEAMEPADERTFFQYDRINPDYDKMAFEDQYLLLARFYKLCGKEEEAKMLFRPKVLIAKYLLSDNDDTNDWGGYAILADILTRLGNEHDARAAWILSLGYRLIGDRSESDWTVENEYGCQGPCDGHCGIEWNRRLAEDLYICQDCLDVGFDEECMAKVEDGTLGWRLCGKGHERLRIPKWDAGAAEGLEKGQIYVGETVRNIKEWKDEVIAGLLE